MRSVGIPIQKGVHTGEELTLDMNGKTMHVKIRIEPHPVFKREARDSANLIMHAATNPLTLLTGGSHRVKGIDDEELVVEVPPMSRGHRLLVRSKGLPVRGMSSTRGDLYVVPVVFEPATWKGFVTLIQFLGGIFIFMNMFTNPTVCFLGIMIYPKIMKALE